MQLPPVAIYCSSGSWGGLEMNTARLAVWLNRMGHRIILCCLENSPLEEEAGSEHLSVLRIERNNRYFDIRRARKVWSRLKELEAGIVIIVDNRDLDFGGLLKILSRNAIRLVYQQHMMLGISKKDLLHTWRFRRLDAWITLLPYMAEEILTKTRYYPDRIHIVPLGVEVSAHYPSGISTEEARKVLNIPDNKTVLGILGRLDRQKGQHLVIEALDQLRKEGKEMVLLIMGEATRGEGEEYHAELKTQINESGLEEHVVFHDYNENVNLFYAAIDLFVLGSYNETYGMVTIESMISGVPVVGSDAGGTAEILEHEEFGWLYEPLNSKELAGKIREALSDNEECKRKVKLAQEHAIQTYSHEVECSKIEHLLLQLIKKPHRK